MRGLKRALAIAMAAEGFISVSRHTQTNQLPPEPEKAPDSRQVKRRAQRDARKATRRARK